jgi:parvulin-like peptidyl-prolyl isomerase
LAKKKKTEKAPREMTRRARSAHRRQQRRQRIIFFSGIGVIAAIILVVLAGWIVAEYLPLHRTILTVNGNKFSTSDFIGYLEVAAIGQQASGQTPDMTTIASSAIEQIPKDVVLEEVAAQLGITVTDEEAEEVLDNAGLPVNTGSIAYIRTYMLQDKLKSDYFGAEVPTSDNQVWCQLMLLESDVQAEEIRDRLVAGDNFTALAPEYALNYYSKNVNDGDFGWHPREVLEDQVGSQVPVEFAYTAEKDTLSQPLADPEMYKQQGYWLIRVLNPPSAESANVDAIFVTNEVLANELRPELESTDNISAIADNYTQFSLSKEKHGYLGEVSSGIMTDAFNNYVFSDNVVIGGWSQPIVDTDLWTQGGSWLVKVLDKEVNRDLSSEDRGYLIDKRYDAWYNQLDTSTADINTEGLSNELEQLAIDRANKYLQDFQG